MKKALSLVLAATVLVGAFTGCSTADTPSNSDSTGGNGSTSFELSGKTNRFGWEIPKETLEISIAYGQVTKDEFEKNTAKLIDYILEEFNVKIQPQYWDTDYGERQGLLMASGDYPDVMARLTVPQAKNWEDSGKAMDMLPLIDKYAPSIRDTMGKYFVRYTNDDGKMYAMPCEWGEFPITLSAPSVRYDWWEEIGKPDMSTPDKFYDALKKMIAAHPTGTDGQKTYALGMYNAESFLRCYQAMWGLKKDWKIDSQNNLTYWSNTDEALEMVKWLNGIYRDGNLDPDSFSQSDTDIEAKFINERYAGHVGSWWMVGAWGFEQWRERDPNWKDTKRFAHFDVVAEGAEHSAYTPLATLGYTRTIITDKARNPEGIIRWFAFEQTDLGMHLLGLGVPNTDISAWNIDEEGNYEWDEKNTPIIKEGGDVSHCAPNGSMQLHVCLPHNSLDGTFTPWWDQNFRDEEKWKKFMNDNMKDSMWDSAYLDGILIDSEDPLAILLQQVKDISLSGFAESVTAPSAEECESKFLAMRDKINQAGVSKLEDYYNEQYKKNVEKWG